MFRCFAMLLCALGLLFSGYALGAASVSTTQAGTAGAFQVPPGCQTFPETGKTVCGRFLKYWVENGGLAQQGYPISGEIQEKSDLNGQTYTVQYFERAVFELHPENRPPYDVLLSQLGTFRYAQKYGAAAPPAPPPAPAATATPMADLWVDIFEPARRNGISLIARRIDVHPKRVDVIFDLRNETNENITFSLRNDDQLLIDDVGNRYFPRVMAEVKTFTLAPGQLYVGGTSFEAVFEGKGIERVVFAINNVPRLGNVRVRIPLNE